MKVLRNATAGAATKATAWCIGLLLCATLLDTAAAALPRQLDAQGRPRSIEAHAGVEVTLGELALDNGLRVRTIVSRPQGLERGPAVLVVPWLSCASAETPPDETDGMSRLIIDLVTRSGAHVWRVDKPGVGDSEGRCDQTDFALELQAYRRAFQAMRTDARTDTGRLVVVGISNGGGIAPLVPDAPVAGYVSVGGWSGTWFEHVVWQERRRLEALGAGRTAPAGDLSRWQRFQSEMLIGALTPGDVIDRHPELAPAWRWDRATQYGRPAAFYQQLQALDLSAAWAQVGVPTLAVWGENDAVMSREESERIVRLVNRGQPAHAPLARLITVPQANHALQQSEPQHDGQPDRVGPYVKTAGDHVVSFVRRVTGQSPEREVATQAQLQLDDTVQGGGPAEERLAVLQTLNDYLWVTDHRDRAAIRRALHPTAPLSSVTSGGALRHMTQDEWWERVGRIPDGTPPRKSVLRLLDVAGVAALARIDITDARGQACTDLLTLLKTREGWRIVSKALSVPL